jgi:hypothetical protein
MAQFWRSFLLNRAQYQVISAAVDKGTTTSARDINAVDIKQQCKGHVNAATIASARDIDTHINVTTIATAIINK